MKSMIKYCSSALLIGLLLMSVVVGTSRWLSSSASQGESTGNATLAHLSATSSALGSAAPANLFEADATLLGTVALQWGATGTYSETLPIDERNSISNTEATIDIMFLLEKGTGDGVDGYVELQNSIVFTTQHVISTTRVSGIGNTITETVSTDVGPKIDGSLVGNQLTLLSEKVSYETESGQAVQRQFQLTAAANQGDLLRGEYRETVWGLTLDPLTIIGTFELRELKAAPVDTNNAPVANPQQVDTIIGTATAITLAGRDEENGAITFEIVTEPVHGTLTGTAPTVTYTPDADYEGSDSFTFKINDGKVDSESVAVSIDVAKAAAPNVAPVANVQNVNAVQAQATEIILTSSDADNDAITYSIVAQPANGSLTLTGAKVTYTSNAGFVGTDTFTFKANDGAADSATAQVSINVTAPNATNVAPIANLQTVNTIKGQVKLISLSGTDADNNALTFTLVSQTTNGTISLAGAQAIYTPNASFVGTDAFTFFVNDGTVDSPVAEVSINVTETAAPNSAPTANDQAINTGKGQRKDITLSGSDADDDTLTFELVTVPANGALETTDVTGKAITYVPNAGFVGTDSFTFKVNDGTVDSPIATININVTEPTGPNVAPVANAQTVNVAKGQVRVISLSGTDADNNVLTYSLVSQTANGTVTINGAAATYTPNASFVGTDSFTFKANDGIDDSAAVEVTINVTEAVVPNSAPVAIDQTVSTSKGQEIAVTLSGSDANNDALTIELVATPLNGAIAPTVDVNQIGFTYTPNAGFVGTDVFTFKVNDGTVDSAIGTITINVVDGEVPNSAPTPTGQSVDAQSGVAKTITLTGADVDGDALTFDVVDAPLNGQLDTTDESNVTYTSNPNFVGTDSFTFKVNDGAADSAIATITINVTEEVTTITGGGKIFLPVVEQ